MEIQERLLSLEDVIHITSLSESTISRMVKDGLFPESVPIGERRVAWIQSEVRYWMEITYNKEYLMIELAKKVVVNEFGCWEWGKNIESKNYASFKVAAINKLLPAHRFSYELYRRMVKRELEMDHLCRNPCCVNPWHVEPVTRAENLRRVIPYMVGSQEPCCYYGHPFTQENTIEQKWGQRLCRTCMQELSTKGVTENGNAD